MNPSQDDEFNPLYCPRCHQRVPRAMANPDGWCHRCVAEHDQERREVARKRDDATKPHCPRCGGTEVTLTMEVTPLRAMRRSSWLVLDLLMLPFTVGTGLWGWIGSASTHRPELPYDPGEPMWRCKACDHVFRMR